MDSTVYAIGGDNAVYEDHGSGSGAGWVSLGGFVRQISASLDASGNPEVFAIGGEDAAWVNHGLGWSKLGTNVVLELAAPAVGIGLPGNLVYEVAQGHGGLLHSGTTFTSIGSGSIE